MRWQSEFCQLKIKGVNMKQGKHLFFCETKYALLSMLIARYTAGKDCEADIVFADITDFSAIVPKVRASGVFENVWQIQTRTIINDITRGTEEDKKYADEHPEEVFQFPEKLKEQREYTDLWLNLDSISPKLFYYALTSMGNDMAVHFVDEGNSSYFMDLSSLKKDFMTHERWKEKSFQKRACDIYLYNPELYQTGQGNVTAVQLEKQILQESWFREKLVELFEIENVPEERYIYFEQCFNDDGGIVNDIEIIEHIASVVGKDNLLIRLHPRARYDRFSMFGYHVTAATSALWEASILANSFENKVYITINSSAVFSEYKLLGEGSTAIVLDKLIWGAYRNKKKKNSNSYLSEMINCCNRHKMNCYEPHQLEELNSILRYLENVDGVH